ncbi:MAG: Ribosomal protein L11 methyltransferase [Anaerolineaceae bacterium 46_22]|nr:MAG: Ribosomal protein L11 methyltransferase [Anaerolineaceae bacterium 46_22]
MADSEDKTHWMQVKIQTDGEIAEALAEVLGRFISEGVVVESLTKFNTYTQENEPTGEVTVSGYLKVDGALETKKQAIEQALWHLSQISPIPQPEYTLVKDQDWMSAWKQHYNPIPLGESLLVLPAWQEPKAGEQRHIIRINPAMAFGTGTHPTTKLCLRLLEKILQPGMNVIDVGCGSGILSIAALKMGANHVIAVDTDEQAITSTLENAELNHISSSDLELGEGSIKEILSGQFTHQQAQLVMVNILAPILIRLFEQGLEKTVQEDGILLLSGILDHQEKDVLEAAKNAGFSVIQKLSDEDWVSFALRKG